MTREETRRAAQLLRAYAMAISNILYERYSSPEECRKDENDCEDLANALEAQADDWYSDE